jgi:hypothetical protein
VLELSNHGGGGLEKLGGDFQLVPLQAIGLRQPPSKLLQCVCRMNHIVRALYVDRTTLCRHAVEDFRPYTQVGLGYRKDLINRRCSGYGRFERHK